MFLLSVIRTFPLGLRAHLAKSDTTTCVYVREMFGGYGRTGFEYIRRLRIMPET